MEENKMADEIMANGKDTSLDLFKGDLDKGFENMGTDDMCKTRYDLKYCYQRIIRWSKGY